MWFLDENQMALIDINSSYSINSLPSFAEVSSVEKGVRFLQEKDHHSREYIKYVDIIYNAAIKKHSLNVQLLIDYGLFLQYYCKYKIKSVSVFKQARCCTPSFSERFVLHSISEMEKVDSGGSLTEVSSAIFNSMLSNGIFEYNTAKNCLKEFWENLTLKQPVFELVPIHLEQIAEAETNARDLFEEVSFLYVHFFFFFCKIASHFTS
jgi:hypothetical protein